MTETTGAARPRRGSWLAAAGVAALAAAAALWWQIAGPPGEPPSSLASPTSPATESAPAAAPPPQAPQPADQVVWRALLLPDDAIHGPADALVTLLVLGTPRCGPCREVLRRAERVAAVAGPLRLAWRHLPAPGEPDDLRAARAAACAHEQGRLWRLLDDDAAPEGPQAALDLAAAATAAGLDAAAWSACQQHPRSAATVARAVAEAAALGSQQGPVIYVQGRRLRGVPTEARLAELVDEERRKAQGLVAQGVAAAEVYGRAVGAGRWQAPLPALAPTTHTFADEAPRLGPPRAAAVLTVFAELGTPESCAATALARAVAAARPREVAVEFRHMPLSSGCHPQLSRDLHPGACRAAAWGVAAAAQGRLWPWEQALCAALATAPPAGAPSEEALRAAAAQAGIDLAAAERALATPATAARVRSDALAGVAAGVRGPGAIFLSGRAWQGARDAAALIAAVDAAQGAAAGRRP